MERKNIILIKSFDFAIQIITLCQKLRAIKEYVLSDQLLRSGTSIGANVHEAQDSVSKIEFRYKMSIALREAKETRYWLLLISKSELKVDSIGIPEKEINEIIKILTSIVKSSK